RFAPRIETHNLTYRQDVNASQVVIGIGRWEAIKMRAADCGEQKRIRLSGDFAVNFRIELHIIVWGQWARFPKPECRRRIRGRSAAALVQQIVPAPPTPAQILAERASAFWPARVTAAVPDFPARCIPGHR